MHDEGLKRPMDEAGLQRLALRYVERFATTRAKLERYLLRKVRGGDWAGAAEPGEAVRRAAQDCVDRRYVDDAAWAQQRQHSLLARGYGPRRVQQALRGAGIDEELQQTCRTEDEAAIAAAQLYARKRRFGPYSAGQTDRALQQRQLAAMLRAGHDYRLARSIIYASSDGSGEHEVD